MTHRRRNASKRGSTPRRRNSRRPKRSGAAWWFWLRVGLALTVGLAVLSGAAVTATLAYYARDLPTVEALRNYRPPQTTRVLDRHGAVLGEMFTERRTVIPMDQIPRVLVLSVLAAEDADFYEHEGLDYPGLLRAVFNAVTSGERPRGTSTITQQVVKLLLLSPERTMERKIREVLLARQLEQELTKDEILHLYLNHINFGHGRYGIQEAARFYFGKDAADLNLAEASLLAGVPQSPTRLSPRSHPDAARRRQRFVLGQLERKREERWSDLDADEIAAAREDEPALIDRPDADRAAPELVAMARRMLRELVGEDAYRQGGYTVHTSLDGTLQQRARAALQEHLRVIDGRHDYRGPLPVPRRRRRTSAVERLRVGGTYDAVVTGTTEDGGVTLDIGGHAAVASIPPRYNPESLPPARFAPVRATARVSILQRPEERSDPAVAQFELGPQGAVLVIDPRTRDVLALIGGYDPVAGFNRATQAHRQPGSTFKPIVYALGIRQRAFTPASIVLDAPQVYGDYRPSDFATREYRGQLTLRDGLAFSANPVAKQVIDAVGPDAAVGIARELGITSELEATVALALGASEVHLSELTNAYATFAAGGRWQALRFVRRVEGPDGRDVPLPDRAEARDVLTPAEAFVVTSLLTSVVERGTARGAARLGRPAAGKTGTSDDARDAWFVGYTPEVVAGVWVGFDDHRPLGRRESGARSALPIWMAVVEAATEGQPGAPFPMPSGVVTAAIDPATGLLAFEGQENAVEEVFVEGTAPIETALPPDVADTNTFLMEQFAGVEGPTGNPP